MHLTFWKYLKWDCTVISVALSLYYIFILCKLIIRPFVLPRAVAKSATSLNKITKLDSIYLITTCYFIILYSSKCHLCKSYRLVWTTFYIPFEVCRLHLIVLVKLHLENILHFLNNSKITFFFYYTILVYIAIGMTCFIY